MKIVFVVHPTDHTKPRPMLSALRVVIPAAMNKRLKRITDKWLFAAVVPRYHLYGQKIVDEHAPRHVVYTTAFHTDQFDERDAMHLKLAAGELVRFVLIYDFNGTLDEFYEFGMSTSLFLAPKKFRQNREATFLSRMRPSPTNPKPRR